MHIVRERVDKQEQPKFPFSYYLDRDADLLILRRPDGSFVVAFNAVGADLFEVELAVWEDAD